MGNESAGRKRYWAKHKAQVVLMLLRGEDLELVSRELGVTAAELSEWRDAFLEGGESGLKPRPLRESVEVDRLQSKIGEQAMEIVSLREKSPAWSKPALWPTGGRGREPFLFRLHGKVFRRDQGLPHLGRGPLNGVLATPAITP